MPPAKAVFAGLAVVTIVAVAATHSLLFPIQARVEVDERPGADAEPRRVLARIQSDLNRAAAHQPRWPLAERDKLESLVDALRAFQSGDKIKFQKELAATLDAAGNRLGTDIVPPPREAGALARLTVALRLVDSALGGDGTLRLPCRLVAGRAKDFAKAAQVLGEAPPTDCPVPGEDRADFAAQEHLARSPSEFRRHFVPEKPVRFDAYAPDGDGQEPWELLDILLTLHQAGAEPDRIRALQARVDEAALAKAGDWARQQAGALRPYDGSDASLVATLRLAALTGAALIRHGDTTYPYAIPCPVARARPDLVEAAGQFPQMAEDGPPPGLPPISGCLIGRPEYPGFPGAKLAAYLDATAAADGRPGPHYPVRLRDLGWIARLIYDPRALLEQDKPPVARPYQTWRMMTLGNRDVAEKLDALHAEAKAALATFLAGRGLSPEDAGLAADRALFALSHGAGCGNAPPPPSIRRALMERAEVPQVLAWARSPDITVDSLAPFAACAQFAPMDPLVSVAVSTPAALAALWPENGSVELADFRNANARNSFGKTPLMQAAQSDQPDSIRFLLDHGARVNADTWSASLSHDGRTALMYAAAHGSLTTIRLLLANGADPHQADSRGLRAIHYLLGLGPVPPNLKLSPEETTVALKALF